MVEPKTRRTLLVNANLTGARVERLVMEMLACSRSEARALCANGRVRLDGRRVDKGARAAAGATLEVELPEEERVIPEPDSPLDVRLKRGDVVVVHKPAGMPTVPLRHGERGTLAGALIARYPEMLGFGHGPREPGVVHRLDTQTSGLVVAARDPETFVRLAAGLREGALQKRYVAICEGANLPLSGDIDFPLCSDPRRYGRVKVAEASARYRHPAQTQFRVLERGPHFVLLELTASPAFRHQIRAHLAAIGHPIAGDTLYGGARAEVLGARHALHASYIAWAGERTEAFAVTDETPRVFLELLRSGAES